MRIELKRKHLIIVPENEHDRAFIEDTLSLKRTGDKLEMERVDNVSLGFASNDEYVLKTVIKNESNTQR